MLSPDSLLMFRMRISALRCDICAALQPSGTSQAGNWQSLLWSEALQVLMKPAKNGFLRSRKLRTDRCKEPLALAIVDGRRLLRY